MSDLYQLLMMGKYTAYVWSAYGFVVVIFIINFISVRRYQKRVIRRLNKQIRG